MHVEVKQLGNPKLLPELADKIKGKLGDPAVVVLGVPGEGKVNLLVAATPGAAPGLPDRIDLPASS